MAENSKIGWTTHTFNPWRGCTKVHEGCKNCYAESNYSVKMHGIKWGPNGNRLIAADSGWKKPLAWNRAAEKSGVRAKVFCASLADVFEDWQGPISTGPFAQFLVKPYLDSESDPKNWISAWSEDMETDPQGWRLVTLDDVRRRLFELIDATPHLDWLLLTKRPENIRKMVYKAWTEKVHGHVSQNEGDGRVWKCRLNVWLGTSISNKDHYQQIENLKKCRDLAPVLFLSGEPLLGPMEHLPLGEIDWVITGCESGYGRRQTKQVWVELLKEQCEDAGVAFFNKQMEIGGKVSTDISEFPEHLRIQQFPEVKASNQ